METTTTQHSLQIVKGITLTPPVIGRIMMGHVEIKQAGGKLRALPSKDDHFTITTLVQGDNRIWERHPLDEKLKAANEKLTAIPIRLAYNDPGLMLRNRFTVFDNKNRQVCSGNGVTARRATENGVQTVDCPRPENCRFGQDNRCANYTRFYTQIEGQSDPLGVFALRTASHNSLDYLAGHLLRLHGLTQGKLAGMPLMLKLVPKTTAQSMWSTIYFANLELRPGHSLIDALRETNQYQGALEQAGLSQERMEAAMREGMANSDFADEIEDADEWSSDEEMLERAVSNLGRQGLRGLDELATRTEHAPQPVAPAIAPSPAIAPTNILQMAPAPESDAPPAPVASAIANTAPPVSHPVEVTADVATPHAIAPESDSPAVASPGGASIMIPTLPWPTAQLRVPPGMKLKTPILNGKRLPNIG